MRTTLEEGYVLLIEAIMEQAYKDLKSPDENERKSAERFINDMKKTFGK